MPILYCLLALGCGGSNGTNPSVPAAGNAIAPAAGNAIAPAADRNPKAQPQPEIAGQIDAGVLWVQYGDNELGADKKFKGKYYKVSGRVKGIKKAKAKTGGSTSGSSVSISSFVEVYTPTTCRFRA
jgi:hypothetical protein